MNVNREKIQAQRNQIKNDHQLREAMGLRANEARRACDDDERRRIENEIRQLNDARRDNRKGGNWW